MERSKTIIGLAYLALVLIWGSTWIAIKVSVGVLPFTMAAIRFSLASGLLAVYQRARGRQLWPPRNDLKIVLVLGLGNFFIGYGLTYWGMQYVRSNVTSILWATMPIQVTIIAHFLLKNEQLNLITSLSLLAALFGSWLLFDIHGRDFDARTAWGMVVILLSILAAAWSNVLYKRQGTHLDPVAANLGGMFLGAVLLLLTGLLFEPWTQLSFTWLRAGATLYLALFGSAIGFSLYFWLFKHVSVVKMSYSTFLLPIIASFWGWLILGERLTPTSALGAGIILLAVSIPELPQFRSRPKPS